MVLSNAKRSRLRGAGANVLDCGIVVSEFELQSRYYVHFRTDTLEKSVKYFTPTSDKR